MNEQIKESHVASQLNTLTKLTFDLWLRDVLFLVFIRA